MIRLTATAGGSAVVTRALLASLALVLIGMLAAIISCRQAPESTTQPIPASPPDPAQMERGGQLFADLGCGTCHSIAEEPAAPAGPEDGPNLRGVGLRHNAAWLEAHVKNPRPHTLDTAMPGHQLPPADLDALIAFLRSLRAD